MLKLFVLESLFGKRRRAPILYVYVNNRVVLLFDVGLVGRPYDVRPAYYHYRIKDGRLSDVAGRDRYHQDKDNHDPKLMKENPTLRIPYEQSMYYHNTMAAGRLYDEDEGNNYQSDRNRYRKTSADDRPLVKRRYIQFQRANGRYRQKAAEKMRLPHARPFSYQQGNNDYGDQADRDMPLFEWNGQQGKSYHQGTVAEGRHLGEVRSDRHEHDAIRYHRQRMTEVRPTIAADAHYRRKIMYSRKEPPEDEAGRIRYLPPNYHSDKWLSTTGYSDTDYNRKKVDQERPFVATPEIEAKAGKTIGHHLGHLNAHGPDHGHGGHHVDGPHDYRNNQQASLHGDDKGDHSHGKHHQGRHGGHDRHEGSTRYDKGVQWHRDHTKKGHGGGHGNGHSDRKWEGEGHNLYKKHEHDSYKHNGYMYKEFHYGGSGWLKSKSRGQVQGHGDDRGHEHGHFETQKSANHQHKSAQQHELYDKSGDHKRQYGYN